MTTRRKPTASAPAEPEVSAQASTPVSTAAPEYADHNRHIRWTGDISVSGKQNENDAYVYLDPSDAMATGATYSAQLAPVAGFHSGNSRERSVYRATDVAKGVPTTFCIPVPRHPGTVRTGNTYITLTVSTPSADDEDPAITMNYFLPVTITSRGES